MEEARFVYEDNFQVLNDRMLVDPVLKIFVTMGRLHFEGEGEQFIHVSHDPDMKASILEQISQRKALDFDSVNEEEGAFTPPDFSDKRYKFFEFTLRKLTEENTRIYEILDPDERYKKPILGTEMRGNVYECADPNSFLLYVFKNVLLLPELQPFQFGKYNKIQLRLSEEKLAYLERRTPRALVGNAVLAEINQNSESA